ncbi:MAG TPA: VWA-like domain-containing protein [Burkholderiales bacterium]|nr:VWA-like domain-containing protein [Burkholderiales bacterium]
MIPDAAATKLAAARARLILERPFIGALVMHLPLVPATGDWCASVATDARAIYYNAEYVDRLSLAEAQFVLAHEAMHCALGHLARRSHRTVKRWDVACDHAVNLLLVDEGMVAPPDALLDAAYRGLSAEEIYPLLPLGPQMRTLDQHIGGGTGALTGRRSREARPALARVSFTQSEAGWDDAGDEHRVNESAEEPPAISPAHAEALAHEWQGRMASAAQQARLAGRLAPAWLRLVDKLMQPQLPWRALLARYVMSAARDDYSFQRPSRREGAAMLPRLASGEADVCVAIDTSGSVTRAELAEFVGEIDALKSQIRARVTLLACDERLDERAPWRFSAWEPVLLPEEMRGGGGTSFLPVFEWIDRTNDRPDVLVYFTDAFGEFPAAPPGYPVVWLVKGNAKVPWGERVQLN